MKEFLQYLFGRLKDVRPVTHTVEGQPYQVSADGTLGAPVRKLEPQWRKPVFQAQTLSGLAALVKQKVDEFPQEVCLHVVDHLNVELVSLRADEYGRRHVFAKATHTEGAAFKFNQFLEAEQFLIDFRRSFLFNDDAVKVQKLISSLESGMTVNLADDGMSQKLEVKIGTTAKTPVELAAEGIPLTPWRMFRDAAPVTSRFLLRFKTVKDSVPAIALFEIDQVWKLDCVNSIKCWLEHHVKDVPVIA